MATSRLSATVHVVRLGTTAAPLASYLRGHDDAVSWTSDVALAIAFLTADAAKRYAARRLGGVWHVAEVDRCHLRPLMLDEEVDTLPEGDAGVDAVQARPPLEARILSRAEGEALAAHRRAIRAHATSPWAA